MSAVTTPKQDEDFINSLIPNRLLEDAIDWISVNMNPSDVFSNDDLEEWAEENGFKEETRSE